MIFCRIRTKIRKSSTNFCESFELGAVQRCVNLVDFEKCKKWTIWLQNSASIEKRTSPLKYDHFRYPKSDFTASNLSTKCRTSPPALSSTCTVQRGCPLLTNGKRQAVFSSCFSPLLQRQLQSRHLPSPA